MRLFAEGDGSFGQDGMEVLFMDLEILDEKVSESTW